MSVDQLLQHFVLELPRLVMDSIFQMNHINVSGLALKIINIHALSETLLSLRYSSDFTFAHY